jgi:GNAT superfamily N-acetyltransferase
MSIELTVCNRQLWWQTQDDEVRPEHWEVSADIWRTSFCPPDQRHVGDISLLVAELHPEWNLLDSFELDEWMVEFIAETVLNLGDGTLVPELDAQISPGMPRMVILRHFELAEPWRGHGLAAPLVAATLERFSRTARLAVCHLTPVDFMSECSERISAELACVRLGALLERIGFYPWKEVHVLDLRNTALIDCALGLIEQWVPAIDGDS